MWCWSRVLGDESVSQAERERKGIPDRGSSVTTATEPWRTYSTVAQERQKGGQMVGYLEFYENMRIIVCSFKCSVPNSSFCKGKLPFGPSLNYVIYYLGGFNFSELLLPRLWRRNNNPTFKWLSWRLEIFGRSA